MVKLDDIVYDWASTGRNIFTVVLMEEIESVVCEEYEFKKRENFLQFHIFGFINLSWSWF